MIRLSGWLLHADKMVFNLADLFAKFNINIDRMGKGSHCYVGA